MNNHIALILIDVQEGFNDHKWGVRNNHRAEEKMAELLAHGRQQGWLIVHAQHLSKEEDSPLHPKKPGVAFKPFAKPREGEKVIQKQVNSAFIGTKLEEVLREHSIMTNIIAGLTTPHCVSTTARMSGNLGFKTIVVEDATAAFPLKDHNNKSYSADEIHANALVSLHNEFASITDTAHILEYYK